MTDEPLIERLPLWLVVSLTCVTIGLLSFLMACFLAPDRWERIERCVWRAVQHGAEVPDATRRCTELIEMRQ